MVERVTGRVFGPGRLTQEAVDAAGVGWHSDGPGMHGLYLQVREQGGRLSRSWVRKWKVNGKSKSKGLGSAALVSLDEARGAAAMARAVDDERWRGQLAGAMAAPVPADLTALLGQLSAALSKAPAAALAPTFRECAERYMDSKMARPGRKGWTKGTRQIWNLSIYRHAAALLDLPVDDVDRVALMRTFEPMWQSKHKSANDSLTRVGAVLNYAYAWQYRETGGKDLVTVVRDGLGSVKTVVRHREAVPYKDMPALMAEIRASRNLSARMLEFVILTGSRVGEALPMRWTEVDGNVWTVPVERMSKRSKQHRVALSRQALALLERLGEEFGRGPGSQLLVCQSPITGRAYSQQTPRDLLQKTLGRKGYTVHGFRSSFREWAAKTGQKREASEAALSHDVRGAVEAAYWRDDLLEERFPIMQEWADYLDGGADA